MGKGTFKAPEKGEWGGDVIGEWGFVVSALRSSDAHLLKEDRTSLCIEY